MASTALCSRSFGHLSSSRSSNTRTRSSTSSEAAHSLSLQRPQPCSSRPRGAATQAHSSLVSYQQLQQQHSSAQLCRVHARGQPTAARRKLLWSALPPAAAAAGVVGADYGSGGSAGMLPSSVPKGPQRAATQRGSSASTAQPPPASAAAAAAPYPVTMQQEHDQQQQHQQQQQHHSVVMQQESISVSQTHVWLPDQQLWLPHSGAAVANPSNPLSRPHSSSTPSLARVFMGSSATAGRKGKMEDRHVLAALHPEHGVAHGQGAVTPQQAVSLAGVFDGHAGDATATYAARHLPDLVHSAISGQRAGPDGPLALTRSLLTPDSAAAAAFQWFDHWWSDARCDPKFTRHGWDESGSTAVISMIAGHQLVVANAGDSVALLARNGTSQRLSEEHRLDNEAEAERVRQAGGVLVRSHPGGPPRVMGTSTQTRYKGSIVTRSLGDFAFKSPQALISAEPFVSTHNLDPTDRLVLLTSDGVTDVLPDDDMLEVGLRAIEQGRSRTNNGHALASAAAKAVMDAALSKGSRDNITVVAMLLDWGSQYDDEAAA